MRGKRHNHGLRKRCRCPASRWPKCSHPWHFNFHWHGRPHRYSLHMVANKPSDYWMSKSEAEAIRDSLRATIRDGKAPGATQAHVATDRLTLGDVLSQYEKKHVDAPTRKSAARQTMRWHINVLRRVQIPGAGGQLVKLIDKPIDAVKKADVEAVRDARRTEMQRITAELGRQAEQRDCTERAGRIRPGVKSGEVGINPPPSPPAARLLVGHRRGLHR